MNGRVSGRKKFMVDAILNGQPVKLSENGQPVKLSENGHDVVSFLAFCDSSSCCLTLLALFYFMLLA